MNISLSKCQEILDTLPIGYYLGCKVPVHLDPVGMDTYVNIHSREITVSYPCIANTLRTVKQPEDPEMLIRGLLYHEISHLLLTPLFHKNRNGAFQKRLTKYHDVLNIFEDERIESVLRTYYMNVDFRKNIKMINAPMTGKEMALDKDPLKRFYAAVRFRIGPKPVLDAIQTVLVRSWGMTCDTGTFTMQNYLDAIIDIYSWFVKNKPLVSDKKQQMAGSNIPDQKQNGQEQGNQSSGKYPQVHDGGSESTPQEAADRDLSAMEADSTAGPLNRAAATGSSLKLKIHEFAKNLLVNPELVAIETRITKIIQSTLNRRANQSSAASGYAGRIDPRQCSNRDYRWFIKPAANASGKKFSKVKINLFVDNSSSFTGSRNSINALANILQNIEDKFPAFSFDLVRIDTHVELMDKKNRYVVTNGNSNLSREIKPIYNRLQQNDALVANIAVFDGHMPGIWHYDRTSSIENPWSAFNHPNMYIISDADNQAEIEYCCPQAHVKICYDYCNEFTTAVLNALERLLA